MNTRLWLVVLLPAALLSSRAAWGQQVVPVPSPLIESKQEIVALGHEQPRLGITLNEDHRGHVYIRSVLAGSAADRAHLRPGDQIVAFNTQSIHSFDEAQNFIRSKSPGNEINVVIRRNGVEGGYTAVLGWPEGVISNNVTLPAHIVQYALPYRGFTDYPEYVYPNTLQEYRQPIRYGHYGTGYGRLPDIEWGNPTAPSNQMSRGVANGW